MTRHVKAALVFVAAAIVASVAYAQVGAGNCTTTCTTIGQTETCTTYCRGSDGTNTTCVRTCVSGSGTGSTNCNTTCH